MLKLARSIIDTVLGRKRAFDADEETHDQQVDTKKQKLDLIHRVKVTNLPERELASIKKFIKERGYNRIKKAPEWNYAFITVNSEAEALQCVEIFNQAEFKHRKLKGEYIVQTEQEHRDRFQKPKKKKNRNQPEFDENDTRTPAEKLADQVTPFWRMPYEEQLIKKNRKGYTQLQNLKREIASLKDVRDESQRPPCEMLEPIGSPEINGYRTKCEFTIGKNLEGEPTVGFLLGLYRDGVVSVLDPSECLNVNDTAKHIAKSMTEYIQRSDLPVYDRVEKTGCWRTLLTKTQSTGDILILVQMRAADLTPERLEQEKQNLIQFWTQESGIQVTTLLFQVWDGHSNGFTDKAPVETLTGDGYIYEEVLGCRFRLSASAFFQINTPATNILYSKCAEWCSIDANKKTTLLDLCCGTGTIGITMAKSVERVVGIEMVPEAIIDARENAKLNNIENVTYYASKVEDKIDVVTGEKNEEVIAVLDPPR
ncbi:S-adenosyl-L-methionine-dependent methyltransferase [Gilbertella persicaria]|uniref:S-adenosyl-L-methionine-dependent methyltransferase n=1 Tax=Gilbertella persicaria TaxID=101096 RepID=UPI00221E5F5E|nr:S-adenosyl-L-methionine-dependent methyltransferase [Gilbertella persicaria]KAI8085810.1 S-adenosyl-L-methionine-dependent methyltransferase [Gilbertella persicaria]